MNTVQSVVSTSRWMDRIGFLNDFFYGRSYIAAPAELSIPVLLDEKSSAVPVRLAGEQSGGGFLWRRSVELRASGAAGLRWQAAFGSSDRLE